MSELDNKLIEEAYLSMLKETPPVPVPATPSTDNPAAWQVGDQFDFTDGSTWKVTHEVGNADLGTVPAHDVNAGDIDAVSKIPTDKNKFFGAAPADGSATWTPIRIDAGYLNPGSHKTKAAVTDQQAELDAATKAKAKEEPGTAGWAKGVQAAAQGMANSPGTGSGDYLTKGIMGGIDKAAGALGKLKPSRGSGAVRT